MPVTPEQSSFWISRVVLTCLAGFFLVFGIDLLRAAYRLEVPDYFIMTFFAASLIILISAALGFAFVLSMVHRLRPPPAEEGPSEGEDGT